MDSSKIAILPKTLSVEAIVKRLKNDEINLDTEFQRKKSVESDSKKSVDRISDDSTSDTAHVF